MVFAFSFARLFSWLMYLFARLGRWLLFMFSVRNEEGGRDHGRNLALKSLERLVMLLFIMHLEIMTRWFLCFHNFDFWFLADFFIISNMLPWLDIVYIVILYFFLIVEANIDVDARSTRGLIVLGLMGSMPLNPKTCRWDHESKMGDYAKQFMGIWDMR